ncbi:MAG TPA: hypothetical protein VGV61_04055 [Thermoanaerobaculia bacterium]|jgi:hypothetical protein|nr:hypothetical protein [Thermoanaerobaculia bacterium]
MRKPRLLPTLLLLAAPLLPAPLLASNKEVLRDETATFPLEAVRRLKIDVPVGEVHVEVGAADRIETRLTLRCEKRAWRCRDRAARLALAPTRGDDDLSLKVRGYDHGEHHGFHHPDLELRIRVPANLAIAINMGVGELDVAGTSGDLSIDLGVGEARLQLPESAFHSVTVDVGVGEANLSPRSAEVEKHGFLFLGNEVRWREGSGRANVTIDVGVGEANVRLLPAG